MCSSGLTRLPDNNKKADGFIDDQKEKHGRLILIRWGVCRRSLDNLGELHDL